MTLLQFDVETDYQNFIICENTKDVWFLTGGLHYVENAGGLWIWSLWSGQCDDL